MLMFEELLNYANKHLFKLKEDNQTISYPFLKKMNENIGIVFVIGIYDKNTEMYKIQEVFFFTEKNMEIRLVNKNISMKLDEYLRICRNEKYDQYVTCMKQLYLSLTEQPIKNDKNIKVSLYNEILSDFPAMMHIFSFVSNDIYVDLNVLNECIRHE